MAGGQPTSAPMEPTAPGGCFPVLARPPPSKAVGPPSAPSGTRGHARAQLKRHVRLLARRAPHPLLAALGGGSSSPPPPVAEEASFLKGPPVSGLHYSRSHAPPFRMEREGGGTRGTGQEPLKRRRGPPNRREIETTSLVPEIRSPEWRG